MASAMASTTVAGPRRRSPITGQGPTSTDSSMRSPTAAMRVVQGSSWVLPVGTGARRPEASGAPSSMTAHVRILSSTPLGASSSRNSTPSSRASRSSSSSAGIYRLVRR